MCGIAGIYGDLSKHDSPISLAKKMAFQLQHRGPDGSAYYNDKHALLVHTRLSIIDIEGGEQPIHNEDKNIWVSFNGEIYNYLELRQDLVAKGHQFYTHTDTEVIVHLYEEYGEEYVHHLNGQFAISIWDRKKQRAVLCRDRVGIAPLFYTRIGDELFFASEVKALLTLLDKPPKLNLHALDQILSFWAPVSPNTAFENIFEIKPGEQIVFDLNECSLSHTTYWDFPYTPKDKPQICNENEASTQVASLLEDAIKIRLRSDVPVGAYLSGGLDSSILVSVLKDLGHPDLSTFSLTFDDADLDESNHQQTMVDFLNTEHYQTRCQYSDVSKHFLDSIKHIESPVVRTAPIPMGILSSLAHENKYKVVLTGEGADEVFGGYDLFKETKLREFWSRQPDSQWRPLLIKKLYPYLNMSQNKANAFLKSFFGGGVEQAGDPLFSHMPRIATTSKVKIFYSDHMNEALNENAEEILIDTLPQQFDQWRIFDKSLYLESKTLMPGYLLSSQGDRMLMKHSVEGRFPYLDHRVIEYAAQLHPKLKMKGFNEKYILKKAMKNYLPDEIVQRYKQPYRAPNIPSFFSDATPDYVEELLSCEYLDKANYFNSSKVALLLKKIKSGRAISQKDNTALVSILSTQAWHYLFIDQFESNFKAPVPESFKINRVV
jgi:asparagine synthase (glutamine-hydrolysing)